MGKAIIAAIVTFIVGWIGVENFDRLPAVGAVLAISVMGAFIIYFNQEQKK